MKKISNKIMLTILAVVFVLSLAACGEKVTVEMVYASSNEAGAIELMETIKSGYGGIEYTYENSVMTVTLSASKLEKIQKDLENERAELISEITNVLYLNDLEISDDFRTVVIDFKSATTQTYLEETINAIDNYSLMYQCFNNVSAEDYQIDITLKIDGEVLSQMVLTLDDLRLY